MKKPFDSDRAAKGVLALIFGGVGLFWLFGILASIATSGLVLYILYRIATHPW